MNNAPSPRPRRNWWTFGIVTWLLIFGSAMAAWVVYAVRQNHDLVRTDYYDHEIRFQHQIDASSRAAAFKGRVSVAYDFAQQAVTVTLPVQPAPGGKVHFYRPSDAKLDRELPLELNADGTQRIDARGFQSGLWKVRLNWTSDSQAYYFDQSIVVGSDS
jgi:nitrogen fixation protein FixH